MDDVKTFREVIKDIQKGESWISDTIEIRCSETYGNIFIEDRDGDARYKFTLLTSMKFRRNHNEL